MKLAGDPNNPARFKDDATADELREEVMRRLGILAEAGVIDLKALPVPKGGIANSGASWRRSIGRQRGSDFYTILIANCANQCHVAHLFVSNSADVDQCQTM